MAEHDDIVSMRKELDSLSAEMRKNTVLIKKIHRHNVIATTMRFVWLFIIIGIPIIAYIFAGSFIEVIMNFISEEVRSVMDTYLNSYINSINIGGLRR